MLSGKATNTNFIVFGLTRPGLEPMIYCTLGEHANHYITDADWFKMCLVLYNKYIYMHDIAHDYCHLEWNDAYCYWNDLTYYHWCGIFCYHWIRRGFPFFFFFFVGCCRSSKSCRPNWSGCTWRRVNSSCCLCVPTCFHCSC